MFPILSKDLGKAFKRAIILCAASLGTGLCVSEVLNTGFGSVLSEGDLFSGLGDIMSMMVLKVKFFVFFHIFCVMTESICAVSASLGTFNIMIPKQFDVAYDKVWGVHFVFKDVK